MYSLGKGYIQRQKCILHYETQHGVSNSVSYIFLPWKTPQLKQITMFVWLMVQVGDSKMAGRNSSRKLQPEAERALIQSQGRGQANPSDGFSLARLHLLKVATPVQTGPLTGDQVFKSITYGVILI